MPVSGIFEYIHKFLIIRLHVFTVLKSRDYRLFWIGGLFSNLGIWAQIAGRLWLMQILTDSPLMLGFLTLSSLGPVVIFSMWGGVIADRVNRLNLMLITRLLFSLQAFLTGFLITSNLIEPWHLIGISIFTGFLLAIDIPSRQAIIPNLVTQNNVMNAVVLYSLLHGGAAAVGPAFLKPLVANWGLDGLFYFVGITYVLTFVMLIMITSTPHVAKRTNEKFLTGFTQGLKYISNHKSIMNLLIIGIVGGLFGSSFGTLLPVFADKILNGDFQTYDNLLFSAGIGGAIGTLYIALFGRIQNSVSIHIITCIILCAALFIFSRLTWLPASMLFLSLVGGSNSAFGTINHSLLQVLVHDNFRGRVMSIQQLSWGSTALGGLILGVLAQSVNATFSLAASAIITLVITLWLILNSRTELQKSINSLDRIKIES